MQTRPVIAATALMLLAAACSPSSKNEKQYWDNHQKNLTAQASQYPGFKTILEKHKASAEKIMKEAEGISDEEKKAEKMKAANTEITKVLGKMVEVKTKTNSLQDKVDDLNKLKLPKAKHARRNEAVRDAQATIREVQRSLTEAAPEDEAGALEVLKEQVSTLISANNSARRELDSLKPKKAKKKKSKKRKKKR